MPGWLSQWHCGVRAKASGKLLAFIGAVPQTVRVYGKTVKMVEINFLCVHKKLRFEIIPRLCYCSACSLYELFR